MADEFNRDNVNSENTSGTGNGSYDYSSGQGSSYQSSYSSGYNTNGTSGGSGSYQSSYSSYNSTAGSSAGGSGNGGKKKGNGGKIALAVILAAAVGVAGGAGISTAVSHNSSTASAETEESDAEGEEENRSVAKADESSDSSDTESADEADTETTEEAASKLTTTKSSAVVTDVTDVVEEVMPSVVSVYNNFTQTGQTIFGQSYSQEQTATGTGIIISEDTDNNELLIATNNHVVENEDSLEVQFIDETTADANIKGTDESSDLAVIAVSLDDIDEDTLNQIKVATLGDSDNLKIGEPVVAIGNALGYGQSVTTGVVSALDREIQSQDSETGDQISGTFIQTDAAINPGNSGGPLVDLNGNVIGINSSKIGGETVEGMGYAIPISRAVPIIEELMTQKTKTAVDEEDRGYLGISGISVTSQVASAYNMPEGVYVANIIDGGGAADSDLQKGDIITGIEGQSVSDMEELQKQLTYYAAGDKVTLTVERASGNGEYEEVDVDVTLGDKSAIEDYEDSQQSSQRRYGYNNGGSNSGRNSDDSDSGDSADSDSTEDSGDADSSDAGDTQDEGQDNGGYYSFPFSEFFGQN